MKILWINPSFLDYRIPVYSELNRLAQGGLSIIFSKSRIPDRVVKKISAVLGDSAIGLDGERILTLGKTDSGFSNSGLQIPYQPGLIREVMSRKVDVVISEGFFQWTPIAVIRKIIKRTPLVISYERTAHTERDCPRWRTVYRQMVLKTVDAVICNGILSAQYLKKLGMNSDNILTGGMVADTGGLQIQIKNIRKEHDARWQTFTKHPIFLYVGQMIPRKGVLELLKGWKVYSSLEPDHGSLLLAGEGISENSLKQFADREQLPNVNFLGAINYDQIAQIYAQADVFVIATLEDNWSLVVPEAMACGLPVACSKYNGCWPELVKPGENGNIFDPHDPVSISESFLYFKQHFKHLRAMGLRSKQIISAFTPTSAAQAILNACNLALNRKKQH